MKNVHRGLCSSQFQDWGTPNWLFRELDYEFNFQLDAAASPENKKCRWFFTKEDDGLLKDWAQYGSIFVNPPYKGVARWVEKGYKESLKGATVVMILPANTSASWFHNWIWKKAELRFVRGKVRFVGPSGFDKGGAFWPTLIAIWKNSKENT